MGRTLLWRRPGRAEEITAVGRAQGPGELDLTEAEDQCAPAPEVRIAYLLGAIGTTGSGIWLIRLISWTHWPGCKMLLISFESFLFCPNSGVNSTWMRFA